jgi:hypothetical protein
MLVNLGVIYYAFLFIIILLLFIFYFYKLIKKNKIAILLVGENRELEQCCSYMKKHFVDHLNKYFNVDIFAYISKESNCLMNKLPNVRDVKYGDAIQAKEEQVDYQMYRSNICYQMMKRYSSKHNIKYDWIIKTRPDLRYYKNCLPHHRYWSTSNINGRMRVFPTTLPNNCMSWWGKSIFPTIGKKAVIDNQFFIVHHDLAEKAFALKYGDEIIVDQNGPRPRMTEEEQTLLWESHGIGVYPLPINIMLFRYNTSDKVQEGRMKIINKCQ